MNIENYKSGIISVLEILPSEQIVSIVDEVATLAVTIYLKAKYADQIIDRKFKYLRMRQLFDKSWKVIAGSGIFI